MTVEKVYLLRLSRCGDAGRETGLASTPAHNATTRMPMGLPCGRRSPRGRQRWYVARVPEGRERGICETLRRVVSPELLDDAFVMSREHWFSHEGSWSLDTVPMYRGYVFLASRDASGLSKALSSLTLPVELVGAFGHSYLPLADEARDWFEQTMDEKHVLRNSVASIVDGRLLVSEGPLKGQEARVSRVDRHRRRCLVTVSDRDGGFAETMPIDVPVKR